MSPSVESTIGFSRRFLNLIMSSSCISGVKSLYCFDLMYQELFYPSTPPPPTRFNKLTVNLMDSVGLPLSSFDLRASAAGDQCKIDCFPLAGSEVVCADQSGRAFRFDADRRRAGTMPGLHKPKSMPLALFVPNPRADDDLDHVGYGSSLFVMERFPRPEAGFSGAEAEHGSDQFEAFVYRNTRMSTYVKAWHCQQLPPPPFVREPKHWHSCSSSRSRPEISSYAVLGGGSHICLSVNGVGTYCLDTARHTWSEAGEWTLPFHGRAEYVPELKLWFGLSADTHHLAAADLSSMDCRPQLVVGPWKEHRMPEEWKESQDPQLVSLGSGRFCVARFFRTGANNGDFGDEPIAVFTGVEVVPPVCHVCGATNGRVQLRMIPHMSKCLTSNGSTIDEVF
ncbi:uncharacterized protein LOC102722221 [Oryza brachyantha]|nr:uncharacterized protein LOC102722221 [Oryza brachyantha]